uniref:Uncharacterized protein n=1 Tax=Anguilla anguilla TaxID=7936 RepID=A0A0E9VKM3_ANGAN
MININKLLALVVGLCNLVEMEGSKATEN